MSALSSALSLAVLILLLLVANNEGATGGGVCTEGFMDLSLLVAKAATPVGSLADNTLAEGNEGRWIIDGGHAFNCTTATVTEVVLGVDIRSDYGNRNKYPSIEIWIFGTNNQYTKHRTIPIVLSPDNVTTNGLYRYVLPTPFSVHSNNYDTYRLGVYQPQDSRSVVRLYNATTSSTETVGRIRADYISDSSITITGSNGQEKEIDQIDTNDVFMILQTVFRMFSLKLKLIQTVYQLLM
uniref:F5/8 type C domain-containing protein n=1 Tax=Amphimedon queenslandica TaxID=400682 RepID=A0A1X7SL73_AMPQE